MPIRRISSSATLGLKLFVPTFWIVFFGSLTIAILISGLGKSPLFGSLIFKVGTGLFFLLGVVLQYFTIMQLKRVELDQEHLYVTNYFKSYRYTHDSIEKINQQDFGLFKLGRIYLKSEGSLGHKITFLQSKQKFDDFVQSHPSLAEKLVVVDEN